MIFAIKPFEIHDGDGIRTTVFFKGCPLRCKWCHNPESFSFQTEILYDADLCRHCLACTSLCNANLAKDGTHVYARENCTVCGMCEPHCPHRAFEIVGKEMSAEEIAAEVLRDEIFLKESGGGVTFSGGEPLAQVDLCVNVAKILKERGLHLAIDTCGAVPRDAIEKILPYTDTFLFDLKAIDEEVHRFCTGKSNRQILDNLLYLDSLGIPIEIRYPYVPTMNDKEVEKIAQLVKSLKSITCVRVLGYHNYAERKYESLGKSYPLPDSPIPTKQELSTIAEVMRSHGINVLLY